MSSNASYLRTHVAMSADPIELHRVDVQDEPHGYGKPRGFWYEVNGDWRRWARGESFDTGEFLHDVKLGGEKMLEIRTVEALDAFHSHYRSDVGYATLRDHALNWQRVAALYDGIEIAPYLWERRLGGGVDWYYTWDCASGVIWRPRGAVVTYARKLRDRKLQAVR